MEPFAEGVFVTLFMIAGVLSIVSFICSIYCLWRMKRGKRKSLFIRLAVISIIAVLVFGVGVFVIPEPYNAIMLICFLAFFLWCSRYRDKALKRIREEESTQQSTDLNHVD